MEQGSVSLSGIAQPEVSIFGIVNVTEDSFSDGGRYLAADAALAHARDLLARGADVIDVGPASSHPDAKSVAADEEIRRACGVVETLIAEGCSVSIDTWRPEVQRWALAAGVDWLNDIRGFAFPEFYRELADAKANLVVMHSLSGEERADRRLSDPATVWQAVLRFFDARINALTRAGVDSSRLVLDPGMGFFLGSAPEASVYVLARLGELTERYQLPVLVSVSRKSFLGAITGKGISERGAATLAAELKAVDCGARFVRTHDVGALADALKIRAAVR